jgi:hypothetical protein
MLPLLWFGRSGMIGPKWMSPILSGGPGLSSGSWPLRPLLGSAGSPAATLWVSGERLRSSASGSVQRV